MRSNILGLPHILRVTLLCVSFCFLINYSSAQELLYHLQQQYEKTSITNPERFYHAGKYIQGLFFNQQEEKASQLLKENIQLAMHRKDGKYAAYLYAIQAMNNRILENIAASEISITKAKEYADKSNDLEIKGYVHYCEGWLRVRNNKEGDAVRSFLAAITYLDKAPPSPTLMGRKSFTYKELTSIYANWNEYALQEKYSLLTLDLAVQQQDPMAIFDAYMSMGYMHEQQYMKDESQQKQRDQAEKYYLQAIHTYHKNKNKIPFPSNLSFVAINLANLYFKFYPDNYKNKVLYYAELAKKQGIETQQYTHVASAYGIMAEIAKKENNPKKAKEYLISALTEITKSTVTDQNIILSIYQNLSELAETEGDLPEAIRYHKAYMETFKSLYDQEQLEIGKRLEAQFDKERQRQQLVTMHLEAEKKEQQISLMQTISLQQKQEFENLKLHEENQRKQLELTQLESEKRTQELKLARLETQNRAQDILSYQNEISYKEKINTYYVALILVFLLLVLLLLYAYKQRSKSLKQHKELYNFSLEKEKQNSKISTLTAMLEGQEQERGRMARDLHDGLGGLLSSTKITLSRLHDHVANPIQGDIMEKSLKQLDTAVEELRRIAHNLMPDLLNRYGLQEALQDYAIRMSHDLLDIDVQFLHYSNQLEKDQQLLVYRIIQELVNNAIKHADPKQIIIQIVEEIDNYSIIVEDDGKGFDIETTRGSQSAGLHNIQSRIDFLKGNFHIQSEEQLGTSVEITFPKIDKKND
ncbi:histidine kinase [Sphingobacterium sp. SRCM116780]|uniref:ATP-binding protein n=1 Tax=Sphingobacterium sp. SRCM116780 TaxID=2907623 RepID=UPI001F292480|nr:sensor histidine kinase [Sphingobacterium sp. SRCM116780]UIR57504.1 histidine kinase [Sphingobacterium sp. SRCM116780]